MPTSLEIVSTVEPGYFQRNMCAVSKSISRLWVEQEYIVTRLAVMRKYESPVLMTAMGDEIAAVPARCRARSGFVIQIAAEMSYHAPKAPSSSWMRGASITRNNGPGAASSSSLGTFARMSCCSAQEL